MRPSRRYGFNAMGSRYERKADILIAVDVSGSITDESFARFYHAIKNFFFLRIIENIDLIFFDVNLRNTKAVKFSKNFNLKEITGRGGTNFQPPVDFYMENRSRYSGMIIFTDGEGEVPKLYRGGAETGDKNLGAGETISPCGEASCAGETISPGGGASCAGEVSSPGGEASCAGGNSSASILWILDSRQAFEKSRWWIESLPGNWATFLP